MRRVLVTGGLGFVGSHLVERLLEEGCQVTIVDSLLSNVSQPSDFQSRCEVLTEPIEDIVAELLPGIHSGLDEIYHLASVVGPAGVLRHAGDIARTVVTSGDAVMKLAEAHRARLVLVSTSEVYGRPGVFKESDHLFIPSRFTIRLEYASAKLTSEIAALNRACVSDLAVNVVRPFNIAGPRQLPYGGFVLPRFVISALINSGLTVFGDGTQVRAFTDVRDIVSGIVQAMRSPHTSRIYNVGNAANELSILELARRVVRVIGSSASIEHVDPKILFGPLYEEGFDKVPDASLAIHELGWKPQYDLDATIRDTTDWYRQRPEFLVCPDKKQREKSAV